MKMVRAAVPVQMALPEREHQSADILQNLHSDSNWVFYLSLMSSWLNQLAEMKLRDVGVVMLCLDSFFFF